MTVGFVYEICETSTIDTMAELTKLADDPQIGPDRVRAEVLDIFRFSTNLSDAERAEVLAAFSPLEEGDNPVIRA